MRKIWLLALISLVGIVSLGFGNLVYASSPTTDLAISREGIFILNFGFTDWRRQYLGVSIHNKGNTVVFAEARAFLGDPERGGILIGEVGVELQPGMFGGDIIPWNVKDGEYEVFVVIDPENKVLEADETNNRASKVLKVISPSQTKDSAGEELYQEGLFQETASGDLEAAINVYKKIVAEHSQNRTLAARAQARIGICYDKLGKTANDKKLNEAQRLYRNWTEQVFGQFESRYANMTEEEKASSEKEWLGEIEKSSGRAVIPAINGLAAIRSRKAVPALLRIAAERREKDNADRWVAVRALGLIRDDSVVPELVHLTYHYNQNTRFWAQISLVRLTGQDFGRDVAAWRRWWQERNGNPPISDETVTWTTRSDWANPEAQEASDWKFIERLKSEGIGAGQSHGTAPRIVTTSPRVGATDVGPALTEITVTFDRDMAGGFSWTGGGPDFPPRPRDSKAHWRDKRTCVLPVKLKAGRYYRVGINSTSYQNFRSVDGVPSKPSAIYFTTEGAREKLKRKTRKPEIVTLNPPNGARDVDPDLVELRVTFSVPMGGGFSWTGGGPLFPKIPAGKRPYWTNDRKTCVLPVKLNPDQEYRLGLNSPSYRNFQSAAGLPLDPVVYTFRTSEKRHKQ